MDNRRAFLFACVAILCAGLIYSPQIYADDAAGDADLLATQAHEVLRVLPLGERLPVVDATHPLAPALQYAYERYVRMSRQVRDYTCTLYRRERIDRRLRPYESVFAKVRHAWTDSESQTPFSVYLRYNGPSLIKGREALYVDGGYENKLIVTRGGDGPLAGVTVSLNPAGSRALADSLYSVSDFGMKNLARRLIEVGIREIQSDKHPDEWKVRFYSHATIGGRDCTCVQIQRTRQRPEYSFYLVRVFVDSELEVPVRYALFDFPNGGRSAPLLMEEYTYTDIQLNTGLDGDDFRRDNPSYRFYNKPSPAVP